MGLSWPTCCRAVFSWVLLVLLFRRFCIWMYLSIHPCGCIYYFRKSKFCCQPRFCPVHRPLLRYLKKTLPGMRPLSSLLFDDHTSLVLYLFAIPCKRNWACFHPVTTAGQDPKIMRIISKKIMRIPCYLKTVLQKPVCIIPPVHNLFPPIRPASSAPCDG